MIILNKGGEGINIKIFEKLDKSSWVEDFYCKRIKKQLNKNDSNSETSSSIVINNKIPFRVPSASVHLALPKEKNENLANDADEKILNYLIV